jgi:hypothetical protein
MPSTSEPQDCTRNPFIKLLGDDIYVIVALLFFVDSCSKASGILERLTGSDNNSIFIYITASHARRCPDVLVVKSYRTTNMKTHVVATCIPCKCEIGFYTEPWNTFVGRAAAFATAAAAGSHYKQFYKLFCLLGLQPIDAKTYRRHLSTCKDAVREVLDQAFEENREVERQLAIEKGEVGEDNVPERDVICDGGYSMINYGKY